MLVILALGFACLASALLNLPVEKLDYRFLILFCFTIGLGSRITIQIPCSVAYAMSIHYFSRLLYLREIAVILAASRHYFRPVVFATKNYRFF